MTPIFHQTHPDVFPNPHAFLPERWNNLEEPQRIQMERHLVPYSKGTRQCAGLESVSISEASQVLFAALKLMKESSRPSLANAELYMCIPALATRFDFELFETDDWDVDMAVDSLHHYPRVDSKSVRDFAKASTFLKIS